VIRIGTGVAACRLSADAGAVALDPGGGLWRCDLAGRTATMVAKCRFGSLGGAMAYFATISPSSRLVAWTSIDAGEGVLVLVDVTTGKEMARVKGHGGNIHACAIDVSDSFVVSGGMDGMVMTWRMQKGLFGTSIRLSSRIRAHDNPVTACAVGAGAGLIVSGDTQGVVRVWKDPSSSPVATLHAHVGRVTSVALAEQAGVFASAGFDGWIRLWRADTCAEIASLPTPGRLYCFALSEDGRRLIAGGEGGEVHVLSLRGHAA
jgi:WD40 repeat protein